MVDLCIRNARLRHKGDELFDIAISDGRIVDIGKRLGVLAWDEIDLPLAIGETKGSWCSDDAVCWGSRIHRRDLAAKRYPT